MLDEELDQIIDWIENNETPLFVCQQLGICIAQRKLHDASAECDVCKLVVDGIEYFIEDKHTEEEVIAYLEALCGMFQHVEVCDKIVEYGVEEFIELIKSQYGAAVVCNMVGLCL